MKLRYVFLWRVFGDTSLRNAWVKNNRRKEFVWCLFGEFSVHGVFLCVDNIFTDRVRSTTVRYCFHRCLSVHTSGGGTPARSSWGRGTPARSSWGVTLPGGTPPWVPPIKPGQGGTPARGLPLLGGTPPQVPPVGPGQGVPTLGTPLSDLARGQIPEMEYLKRRGQYASCVHAGGLSYYQMCLIWFPFWSLTRSGLNVCRKK